MTYVLKFKQASKVKKYFDQHRYVDISPSKTPTNCIGSGIISGSLQ